MGGRRACLGAALGSGSAPGRYGGRDAPYWRSIKKFNSRLHRIADYFQWSARPAAPHPSAVAADIVAHWRQLQAPREGRSSRHVWHLVPDTGVSDAEAVLFGTGGAEVLPPVNLQGDSPPVPLDDAQLAYLLKESRTALSRLRGAHGGAKQRQRQEELLLAKEVFFTAVSCLPSQAVPIRTCQALGSIVVRAFTKSTTALLGCCSSAGEVQTCYVLYAKLRQAGVADSFVFLDMVSAVSVAGNRGVSLHGVSGSSFPLPELLSITYDSLWGGVALTAAFYHVLLQNALYHSHTRLYFTLLREFDRHYGLQNCTPAMACHMAWALSLRPGHAAAALQFLQSSTLAAKLPPSGRHPPEFHRSLRHVAAALIRDGLHCEAEALAQQHLQEALPAAAARQLLLGPLSGYLRLCDDDPRADAGDALYGAEVRHWLSIAEGRLGGALLEDLYCDVLEEVHSSVVLRLVESRMRACGVDSVRTSLKLLDKYAELGMVMSAERLSASLVHLSGDATAVYGSLLAGYAWEGDMCGVLSCLERLASTPTGRLHRGLLDVVLRSVASEGA